MHFDDSLRKVTAIALEDVLLAIITQENLDGLIDTNHGLGEKLLKGMLLTVSDGLRKSFDRIVAFFCFFLSEKVSVSYIFFSES